MQVLAAMERMPSGTKSLNICLRQSREDRGTRHGGARGFHCAPALE